VTKLTHVSTGGCDNNVLTHYMAIHLRMNSALTYFHS